MRKLAILIIVLIAGAQLNAQTAQDYTEVMRDVLKTEKKAAIAEVMQLTEAEAEPFWALYNEYNNKQYEIGTKMVKVINDFAEVYGSMTDEKADELMTRSMKIDAETLSLEKSYYKKFKKILPASKVVKYFQAENKIRALIDFELAKEIPFVEMD